MTRFEALLSVLRMFDKETDNLQLNLRRIGLTKRIIEQIVEHREKERMNIFSLILKVAHTTKDLQSLYFLAHTEQEQKNVNDRYLKLERGSRAAR